MIGVAHPEPGPEILNRAGAEARDLICIAYDTGQRAFTFDSSIYAAEVVKQVLNEAQYGKCAFCERQVGLDSDIEHFRPKSAAQQKRGGALSKPGYYWLAYEWSNLLLSCTHCNCRHKRNLFPLANPRMRAKHHRQSIGRELPLLINPAEDDPGQFLSFRDQYIYAVQGNHRGEETIRVLGLDREALNEERLSCLQRLQQLHKFALLLEEQGDADAIKVAAEIRIEIDRQCSDAEPFAAMACAARSRDFRPFAEQ